MRLGYNTNGLANHGLESSLELISRIGYQSVALTVDHHALNPFDSHLDENIALTRASLERLNLSCVIETGARFLLDPSKKHEPTLMSASNEGRQTRIDFLKRCIDIASELSSDAVSLWSGILRESVEDEMALERLSNGLREVVEHAKQADIILAFEPEPGMFIDTLSSFERLLQWIDSPYLQLTIDVGHLYCQGEMPISTYLQRFKDRIANIHIEDMKAGVHEHLMFGDGEMSFPPIIETLSKINYTGGLHVELSRHSHVGPEAARQAFDFLSPICNGFYDSGSAERPSSKD